MGLDGQYRRIIDNFKHELAGIRAGRASTALLDPIKVEIYGSQVPLNHIATISTPEPRMLSVQVWDKANLGLVEKAIRSAGIGINPINDGNNIRLPIPTLTEERRKELTRLASKYAEKARVAIRQVRRQKLDALEDPNKGSKRIQTDTEAAINEVNNLYNHKKQDLEA